MAYVLQTTCREKQVATTLEGHINCTFTKSGATVMHQQPFDLHYYKDTNGQLLPVTILIFPASQAIIELVSRTNCSMLKMLMLMQQLIFCVCTNNK